MFSFFRERVPALTSIGPTVGFRLDYPRFERVMGQIARGLYYHHFQSRHTGPVHTMSPTVFATGGESSAKINTQLQKWNKVSANLFTAVPRHGDNPGVFYYQVVEFDEGMELSVAIRQVFYEGFTVDAVFYPTE